jgi:hypothetical protein
MAAARVGHTATVLPDGRVLVVGGAGPEGEAAQAEVWDPRTNLFTAAGTLGKPRLGHAAMLLLDGRVVVVGGIDPVAATGIAEVEVWDPSSLRFAESMSLAQGRNLEGPGLHSPTSPGLVRLQDGRVLMVGVFVLPYDGSYRGVVVWSPSTGATHDFEMARHRDGHAATLLADGRVLVTGGRSTAGEVLDSVELWDPVGGFQETTPLSRRAANHTAVLLADGRILIVLDGSGPEGVVEPFIYEPEPPR